MRSKKLSSEIFRIIREGVPEEEKKNTLVINGERVTFFGKKIISLEMTNEFISVWCGLKNNNNSSHIEINLYVFNLMDNSLWHGGMVEHGNILESKILFPKSVEYMCAMNSMRSYIGDLFLMRPHDLRILEVLDMFGKKTSKSSVENYLKVLYKMIMND